MTDASHVIVQRELGDSRGRSNPAAPIALQKAQERLRQEQETFDQKKLQDARWFVLRMAMGILAALIMPSLIVVCVLIISDPYQDAMVKSLVATTLLVDIVGLVGTIWKVILNPASVTQLAPVTEGSRDWLPSDQGQAGDWEDKDSQA